MIDPTINVSGKGDHVPEPERMIRTFKDSTCCTKTILSMFKKFPNSFIVKMIAAVILFYNFSISVGGASTTILPYTIMTRRVLNVKGDCVRYLGEYVMVYNNVRKEQSNSTDVMRALPTLATHPTINKQGLYLYFNLSSGKVMRRS